MVAGGLIGAIGAYIFQAYGGRQLGTEAFAPVAQLWTVFFIIATVLLVPVEQYITREVAGGRKVIPGDLVPAMTVAAIGAVVGGGFVFFTLDRLFAGSSQYVIQIVLLMVGYGLLVVGKGVYAGRRQFAKVGWVLIVETVVRLAAGIVAIQLAASAESLGWAMVLGGFAVLGMGWWRYDQGHIRPPAAPPTRFLGGYVGGTASSQVLLGAAPVAVALLGGDQAIQSIVFATFTLFRAPLTLIFSLQGRVLPYLVGMADSGDRKGLAQIARLVVIGGVVLAGLGALGWLAGRPRGHQPSLHTRVRSVCDGRRPYGRWCDGSSHGPDRRSGPGGRGTNVATLHRLDRRPRYPQCWRSCSSGVPPTFGLLSPSSSVRRLPWLRWLSSQPVARFSSRNPPRVLGPEAGWESPTHLNRYDRDVIEHHQPRCLCLDQADAKQDREGSGQPHPLPLLARPNQAKQLGNGARADCGHPEPPHIGVRGLEPTETRLQPDRDHRPDPRRRPDRSARRPHGAQMRRTSSLATPGHFGSHPLRSTSEHKPTSRVTNVGRETIVSEGRRADGGAALAG